MNESRKRNIIIASLCGILLLMAVGYAIFQRVLNIEGTASITSNWDIKITNIQEKAVVGSASSAEEPTHEELTATFSVNLVDLGDSISYDVTIKNQGNLDAELEKINVIDSENPAIKFETSGIKEGSTLKTGGTATLNVKITYYESVTGQPEDTEANIEVTLDYVQKGTSTIEPEEPITIEQLKEKAATEGEGLYTDPLESGRYVYQGYNPNNYITFNGEVAGWRIISIEENGELKIMKNPNNPVTTMRFDSQGKRDSSSGGVGGTYCAQATDGCNVYAKTDNYISENGSYKGSVDKDSEMKTYLENEYYPTISTNLDAIATNHIWYYGSTYPGSEGHTSEVNLPLMVTEEKKYSFTSNIGLISPSDYIKANTNTALCGTAKLHYNNNRICRSTNWMTPSSGEFWTLSPFGDNLSGIIQVVHGYMFYNTINEPYGVVPSLYLKSSIGLKGSGTQDEPYNIIT